MCEPRGNDGAKVVHESVPQEDTQEPGVISGEMKSITEIKENLFSCSDGGDVNLGVQSENSHLNSSTASLQQSTHVPDLNLSTTSLGFSVHKPVENDDRVNNTNTCLDYPKENHSLYRALSQSSGFSGSLSGSVESEPHFHGRNSDSHDPLAMRQAFMHRKSSDSLSSSFTTEEMRRLYDKELISGCDKCRLLRGTCPSKESIEFWDDVDICGGDDKTKCHSKFWNIFLPKLKEKFPHEDGLNSKQTMNLLKTILNVQNTDDGEITLANFVKIVRFFGPLKKDEEGKCIIIHHLTDIVKRSLIKSTKDKKKISWFAGDMSREKAENILKNQEDNTYLVRMSQSGSDNGNFVVSVKDRNGLHHFEIEGNPEASSKSASLDCHLKFFGKSYETLPGVVEDLKYRDLKDEEDDEEVQCTYICPDLPFNTVITPYKRT